ncbi:MAG: VPLPA-CTERM sorting domain-containing protein [Pseudomonadota bacterium]
MKTLFQRIALCAAVMAAPFTANAVTVTGFLNPNDASGAVNNLFIGGFVSASATAFGGEEFVFPAGSTDGPGTSGSSIAGNAITGRIVAQETLLLQNFSITINPSQTDTVAMLDFNGIRGSGDLPSVADGMVLFPGTSTSSTSAAFPNTLFLMAGDILEFTITGFGLSQQPTSFTFSGFATPVPLPPAALFLLAAVGGLVVLRKRASA